MAEPQQAPSTVLPTERYLEELFFEAMVAFVRNAEAAGLDADVPTCPGWKVRDLVAHQGMVHRWAAASLRGDDVPEPEAFEREGLADPDPLEWLRDGAIELAQTLSDAPEDVRAPVFLKDAPAPRAFWARRQCHETTMHAVDALAAALGRLPTADEVWFGDELALDGIDELLVGFLQRGKSRLRADPAGTFVVVAGGRKWSLALSPDAPAVTTRFAEVGSGWSQWFLSGPAPAVYLQLWNRAAAPERPRGILPVGWRELSAISW